MKFVTKVKISKQGQITFPLEARKDLHIALGDEVFIYETNKQLILTPNLMSIQDIKKQLKKEVKDG